MGQERGAVIDYPENCIPLMLPHLLGPFWVHTGEGQVRPVEYPWACGVVQVVVPLDQAFLAGRVLPNPLGKAVLHLAGLLLRRLRCGGVFDPPLAVGVGHGHADGSALEDGLQDFVCGHALGAPLGAHYRLVAAHLLVVAPLAGLRAVPEPPVRLPKTA